MVRNLDYPDNWRVHSSSVEKAEFLVFDTLMRAYGRDVEYFRANFSRLHIILLFGSIFQFFSFICRMHEGSLFLGCLQIRQINIALYILRMGS